MSETTTRTAMPSKPLLHRLIEEQVDRAPDALAVTCLDIDLDYATLDRWSNRLAHRLRADGVGPETTVAVIAERSAESVVAQLAVLKAGGVYVPVDPANPPSRFHYLMADSGASVLVTPEASRGAAPEGDWTTIISDQEYQADQPDTRPDVAVSPDNAAYVIYTSGSTGQPKGVTVTHRQIVHATLAHRSFDRPEPACFLLLISFSFDANAVGLYWTLTTGGQVIVPTASEHRDPKALRDLIAKHRVTHLDCTPSLYSVILGDEAAGLASLHCAIVGGEACPPALVERHHALLPECLLVNNYGPTEATVWTTTATLTPDAIIPIGAAIPGARTYLLDENLVAVPGGEVGELYVGGAGVARGYHERAGLTGEWFLPDPWAEPGGRMYRTGDRARELPDGQLEFCGRVDHQVKVRGFRIELAEVEQALSAHPLVAEAVADVRDLGGTAVLLAWVSVAGSEPVHADAVRAHVADLLPAHMVPNPVVLLDELPRNVAGKIDRTALATPRLTASTSPSRDMTPLETEVAELVTHILELPTIGATDSFFDLGATSLHLSRMAMAMWSRFGVGIPIHHLFEVPHVAGAAHIIEATRLRQVADTAEKRTVEQLLAETVLDESINAAGLPSANWADPKNIFLTGATGYLGAFMVKELIERTNATLWCLVRAGSAAAGMDRIRESMRTYLIWDDSYTDRIETVTGDFALPLFGLGEQGFERLSKVIDTIYHCGAKVNFIYPYSQLKAANVNSVESVLRLAATHQVKAVHYISSIDVFLHTGQERPYLENTTLIPVDPPEGYPRSKWAGDHLAATGRERGIPVSIYRPGMMLSHTKTGATQTNDYLLLQIKGLLEFGVIPDMNYLFDAITIDYGAAAIAHISLRQDWRNRNFHLWNLHPVPITEVHEWVRSFGYQLETVALETAIGHMVTLGPDNPLFPLLPLAFEDTPQTLPAFTWDVLSKTDLFEESANTLAALDGSGIECPLMTADLAHKCLSYMVDLGFLPTPQEQRARLAAKSDAVS